MLKSFLMPKFILIVLAAITLCSCNKEEKWTALVDNDLSHWDNYLSYRLKPGYDGPFQRTVLAMRSHQ